MDLSNRSLGRWGEDRAARYLTGLGYLVVDRNWRAPEREVPGEIDIVAIDRDIVVVCEVKTRRDGRLGGAIGAVTPAKQHRIRSLTESWLRRCPDAPEGGVRFDVVTVEGVRLRHWIGAF